MAKNKERRWLMWGAIALIIWSMYGNYLPKEAVADVSGQPCALNEDCPCWSTNQSVYGIGTANCVNGACDTTYCVDVEPVRDWLRDHPWEWVKQNVVLAAGIALLIGVLITWPKQ